MLLEVRFRVPTSSNSKYIKERVTCLSTGIKLTGYKTSTSPSLHYGVPFSRGGVEADSCCLQFFSNPNPLQLGQKHCLRSSRFKNGTVPFSHKLQSSGIN